MFPQSSLSSAEKILRELSGCNVEVINCVAVYDFLMGACHDSHEFCFMFDMLMVCQKLLICS